MTKSGPLNQQKATKGLLTPRKIVDELDRDHEASEQAEMSTSRRKIQLQETVKAEEIDEEKWTKLKGRSIVSACRFSQGDLNIMENVLLRNGLGSSWIMRCQNESCLPWFQRRFIRGEERWPGERARSEVRERKNRLWWNPLEISPPC